MNTLITPQRYRQMSRIVWSSMFVLAAIAHLVAHGAFAAYYPTYLPLRDAAITGTAFIELALAALVWTRHERLGWTLVSALMVVYLPIHVFVVTDHAAVVNPPYLIPLWMAWARLFMQGVLILWAAHLAYRAT